MRLVAPSICPSQLWNKNEKSREKSSSVRGVCLCVSTNCTDAVDRLLMLSCRHNYVNIAPYRSLTPLTPFKSCIGKIKDNKMKSSSRQYVSHAVCVKEICCMIIFEPACACCTVGSFGSLSVCPSVCPSVSLSRPQGCCWLLCLSKLPLIGYYLVLLATLCVQRGVVGLPSYLRNCQTSI